MSTAKLINLQHPSASTVNVTLDSSGNATVGNNISVAGTATVSGTASITGNTTVSGNLLMNSGYGSAAVAYGCRAWVNFNGTGTVAIRASANITSITDNGVGDYTLNFTNALSDANYAIAGTTGTLGTPLNAGSMGANTTYSTTACRIQTAIASGGGRVAGDNDYNTVAVFR